MKNLDLLKQKKAEITNKMHQAIKEGNEDGFAQAFNEYTDVLQEAVIAEAKGLIQAADNQVLAGRGVRALTSEETNYYQAVIDAMRSNNPKQALADVDLTLPTTVIDSVFEDLVEDHPLLDAISFMNTAALVEMLINTQDSRQLATWGALCSDIIKEVSAGFDKLDLGQKKLSAFLPLCKAMLDLGPAWIDRFVRTILGEATYNGLEAAIVDGNGIDQPIGMKRDPKSPLHQTNGHATLTPVALNEITPETYGAIVAELAVSPNGLYRPVTEVLLVVNPVDYFTKIMPATTYKTPNGTYVNNIFPFPTKVVQSAHVNQGEAIIGLGKRYFMALGTSKGGKIEYSDEYRFLEDERVYLTKLYGNGKPLDNKSFKLLDISGLKTVVPVVKTIDITPTADPEI